MVRLGHLRSFLAAADNLLTIPIILVSGGALELIGKIIESTIKLAIAKELSWNATAR